MLRNALGLVAGIIVLNVLVVAGLAVVDLRDSRRRRHEIVELEAIWHIHGRARHRTPPRSRRLAGVLVVALALGATTALASPQGRGVVTSVLDLVARGLNDHPSGAQEAMAADGGGRVEHVARVPHGRVSGGTVLGPGSGRPAPMEGGDPSADATVPVAAGGPTVPPSTTAVTAVPISSGQVRVDWVDGPKESGYRVERSVDGIAGWTSIGTVSANVTSLPDFGLTPGTTYYYRVFATNAAGDSTASSVASATTTVDPASPTTLSAVATSPNLVALDWTEVAGATGYRVERATGDSGWQPLTTTGQEVTEFSDAGVAPGTTYSYRVFATNAGGDSLPSDVVIVSTSPAADPAVEP